MSDLVTVNLGVDGGPGGGGGGGGGVMCTHSALWGVPEVLSEEPT